MKKILFATTLVVCTAVSAQTTLRNQDLKLITSSQNVGTLTMDAPQYVGDEIIVLSHSSGAFRFPGRLSKFTTKSKHVFDKNWKWKSSEMFAFPVSEKPGIITVTSNKVMVNASIGKKSSTKSFEYTGMVMPRRAFYTYLRSLKTPPPAMQPQDIYLMSEMNLGVNKVSWMYLGFEKKGKTTLHKYETRGKYNTVITIDDKSDLVSAKEMDLNLELRK